jgi:hypothetical protein
MLVRRTRPSRHKVNCTVGTGDRIWGWWLDTFGRIGGIFAIHLHFR